MRKTAYYAALSCLLGLVWIVLTEQLSWRQAGTGLLLGALSLLAADQLFHFDYYAYIRRLHPSVILRFIPYLLGQVVQSGVQTLGVILTGRMRIGLVHIETDLEDDFEITILASAITLTPGTVTVSRDGQRLLVLWINRVTSDPEQAGPMIKKKMEAMLRQGTRDGGRR